MTETKRRDNQEMSEGIDWVLCWECAYAETPCHEDHYDNQEFVYCTLEEQDSYYIWWCQNGIEREKA